MTAFRVQWQYEWRPGMWKDFPPEQNEATEHAFQQDQKQAQVTGDGYGKDGIVEIQLDFINMIQTGMVRRRIRRSAILNE